MKKLLKLILAQSIVLTSTLTVISCNIGTVSSRPYLSSLPDYDWVNDPSGDGYEYIFDSSDMQLKENDLKNIEMININQFNSGNIDDIFNYDNYSTGYKTKNAIKKQGVTGAPIVKTYRPNGNMWSDYGISSASRRYEYINSVLDWNNNDLDSEYNVATTDLKNRNFVARSSTSDQQGQVFYNRLQNKPNSNSSIVGSKKPYNAVPASFSYIHNLVGWGSTYSNLGWMSPPHADLTEQLHKNGIPSYGLLYLSGWEDVTKEKLKTMFELDAEGNFKIVDVLIEQCLKFNFDGWFINDEANGGGPNGSVINQEDMYKIINQFNKKATEIKKEQNKSLNIIYYKNRNSVDLSGSLGGDPTTTLKAIDGTTTGFGENSVNNTLFQMDFNRQYPGYEKQFFDLKADLGPTFKNRIYAMFNEEKNNLGIGNNDLRKYLYKLKNVYGDQNYEMSFDLSEDPAYSLTSYDSNSATHRYANDIFNYLESKNKLFSSKDKTINNWLKANIISNQYSIYQFSGYNGYLSNGDTGYEQFWQNYNEETNEKEFEDIVWNTLKDNSYSNDVSLLDVIAFDPRIDLQSLKPNNQIDFEKNPQYIFNKESGKYDYSYGIGNLFKEMTVITDTSLDENSWNEQKVDFDELTTNFSTGVGTQFVSRNEEGQIESSFKNYPWSNARISDVAPTFQWDFSKDTVSQNSIKTLTNDGIEYRSKITDNGQLNVYYDYYDVYKKGNSLSIGNGYDFNKNEGKVKEGIWEQGTYKLNLMGANLQENNYDISFVVKSSDTNNIAEQTKIMVTTQNGDVKVLDSKTKELADNWVRISANANELENINANNRISKIGLQIDNSIGENNFKFNIGEFAIKNNSNKYKEEDVDFDITAFSSDFTIKRKGSYNTNLRFSWEVNGSSAIDYYEIYIFYNEKWYRIGETTQNRYFLHNIDLNENSKIGIMPKFKNNDIKKLFISKN
ncbi:endo-beta-N-acetylglucosaminidase [Spiroplasma culicicola]|uniref:Cytosolic endo-beta-N-acetylglucosaminidase TIM barrel domain-containing protein n=1 Tax=Spiroplasma culicicola AES-1 TaxID=1276246 RepID=W6A849_9MOLU|nr:hypothetical protein [Spiroplasma culicicola]AHI53313.1 hypothetical protein SCULI_v1c09730 [Spiroplasma culicicola AES-1]